VFLEMFVEQPLRAEPGPTRQQEQREEKKE
jgi:hypothetical protein